MILHGQTAAPSSSNVLQLNVVTVSVRQLLFDENYTLVVSTLFSFIFVSFRGFWGIGPISCSASTQCLCETLKRGFMVVLNGAFRSFLFAVAAALCSSQPSPLILRLTFSISRDDDTEQRQQQPFVVITGDTEDRRTPNWRGRTMKR